MSKHAIAMTLALSAAREALGSEAAVERVRAGVLTKLAAGGAPPVCVGAGGAWLGKSLAGLLFVAGAGALLYSPEPPPPSAASAPELSLPLAEAPRPAPAPEQPPAVIAPAPVLPASIQKPMALQRANVARTRSRIVAPPAASSQTPCSDAALEVGLVSRAQELLRAQPKAALDLLSEHAQRFSCGVLGLERDSLRIDAERALGLDLQADQHARELITRYPESMEARALKQKLGHAVDSGSEHKNETLRLPTP